MKKQTKDPNGGLTEAGRREFKRRDGSNLKPGVKKKVSEMTVTEMKRKGSWARRFYGRKNLPALTDKSGKPTRFALTARAWGEPVPRNVSSARKIAEKGERLLARAKRTVEKTKSKAKARRRTGNQVSRTELETKRRAP